MLRNTADWEKSIQEANVRIGLYANWEGAEEEGVGGGEEGRVEGGEGTDEEGKK